MKNRIALFTLAAAFAAVVLAPNARAADDVCLNPFRCLGIQVVRLPNGTLIDPENPCMIIGPWDGVEPWSHDADMNGDGAIDELDICNCDYPDGHRHRKFYKDYYDRPDDFALGEPGRFYDGLTVDRYWQEDYWFGPPNPITGQTDPCSTFREQFWTSSSQMQGGFWTNECGNVQGYELSWRECME
jgi:hypothetical protein